MMRSESPAPVTAPGFTPTREAGLSRLEAFLPQAGRDYNERRNFDLGPDRRDNVSMLSPWIRHRLVREDEVLARVLGRHPMAAAASFVQEVVWRTYWKGWLEMRPAVWRRYRRAVAAAVRDLDGDPGLRGRYEQATCGRTDIACFDAWTRELLAHGYVHNHARMWFASIWIFTLRLPWVLGADLFFRHLLDGDPASNTLSWRWVAGLQTPGKTYLARSDNIARYTCGRFPSEPQLADQALIIREPEPLPLPRDLPPAGETPRQGAIGVLITEDDCDSLSLGLEHASIRGAAGIAFTGRRSPLPVGPAPRRFSRGACADALAQAAAATGCSTAMLDEDATAETLLDWSRSNGVGTIVTAYAPAGPAAEWLEDVEPALAASGVTLARIRRGWDDALWPYARKGYFSFKENVPDALRRLGIGPDGAWDGRR